jgi:hypothetical protein
MHTGLGYWYPKGSGKNLEKMYNIIAYKKNNERYIYRTALL